MLRTLAHSSWDGNALKVNRKQTLDEQVGDRSLRCGLMIKEGEWLGLRAGFGVLYLEVRTIRRIPAAPGNG